MTACKDFLDRPPEELEDFLLRLAREDGAPREAHERALVAVASAAAGAGLVSGVLTASGSRGSLAKATTWLAAKWLAVGLGTGVASLTVVERVQQMTAPETQAVVASARSRSKAPAAPVAARAAERLAEPVSEPEPDPPAAVEPEPVARAQAPIVPSTGNAPAAHEAPSVDAKRRGAAPSAGTSPLTEELSALEQARGALAEHSSARALRILDEYRVQFPAGTLRAEAAALRVEAVAQSGNRELARELAASFLANHPTSPLAGRVRAAVAVHAASVAVHAASDAQKP